MLFLISKKKENSSRTLLEQTSKKEKSIWQSIEAASPSRRHAPLYPNLHRREHDSLKHANCESAARWSRRNERKIRCAIKSRTIDSQTLASCQIKRKKGGGKTPRRKRKEKERKKGRGKEGKKENTGRRFARDLSLRVVFRVSSFHTRESTALSDFSSLLRRQRTGWIFLVNEKLQG